jgi:hypothetical protein
MKLLCPDKDMPELVHALYLDNIPAVLMERTGPGWHVELLRPAVATPHLDYLIERKVVEHR